MLFRVVEIISIARQYGAVAYVAALAHANSTDAPRLKHAFIPGEGTGVADPRTPPRGLGRGQFLGNLGVQDVSESIDSAIVGGRSNLQQLLRKRRTCEMKTIP